MLACTCCQVTIVLICTVGALHSVRRDWSGDHKDMEITAIQLMQWEFQVKLTSDSRPFPFFYGIRLGTSWFPLRERPQKPGKLSTIRIFFKGAADANVLIKTLHKQIITHRMDP